MLRVSDPKELYAIHDEDFVDNLKTKIGCLERFLGPGDTFKFTCDRSGRCCQDRFEDHIILSPYDVLRLRKNLQIDSVEFSEKYAIKILGADSQLPIMLLDFEERNENKNKCPFLDPKGCAVYEDRPHVCRLYPVGRFIDMEFNSYYFLSKTGEHCKAGSGKEYTIEEWLEKIEIGSYLDWNDKFNSLLMKMDHAKYRSLGMAYKTALGDILYDLDSMLTDISNGQPREQNLSDEEMLRISYDLAKSYIEKFVANS